MPVVEVPVKVALDEPAPLVNVKVVPADSSLKNRNASPSLHVNSLLSSPSYAILVVASEACIVMSE